VAAAGAERREDGRRQSESIAVARGREGVSGQCETTERTRAETHGRFKYCKKIDLFSLTETQWLQL
jgi:hypothetical protein